ncbi:MAG: hypothetical protein HY323_08880 [Betaproteobacteria bacterium]|nr:hypothetical protein [Betaproteobacteria bacterium]
MNIRDFARSTLVRNALALSLPVAALSGCYVIPVNPDGTPAYPVGAVVAMPPFPTPSENVPPRVQAPAVLNVRAYPANDLGAQTGVLTGTVTNLMTGKGRFQFNIQGEVLTGEATRVSGDERRGIASAFGNRGTSVRCEYQMNTPHQGAGTCAFSNGAQYTIHIGS